MADEGLGPHKGVFKRIEDINPKQVSLLIQGIDGTFKTVQERASAVETRQAARTGKYLDPATATTAQITQALIDAGLMKGSA